MESSSDSFEVSDQESNSETGGSENYDEIEDADFMQLRMMTADCIAQLDPFRYKIILKLHFLKTQIN